LSLFVDTSVWSLLLRRDRPADVPQVSALVRALETGEQVVTTGLVLQELLQGFSGAKAHEQIVDRFAAFPLIVPDRSRRGTAPAKTAPSTGIGRSILSLPANSSETTKGSEQRPTIPHGTDMSTSAGPSQCSESLTKNITCIGSIAPITNIRVQGR